jgi:hypothetical protein
VSNLKIEMCCAQLAFGADVGIHAGAFAGNGCTKNTADVVMQGPHFCGRQVVGFSQGVNPSGKEGFIGIHIADSGDNALVEKRSFYGDVMAA